MFYGQTIDDADISAQVQVALDQAICKYLLGLCLLGADYSRISDLDSTTN
jgi:hypothetical protein